MNTSEINVTRLDILTGPVATALVTASRNHLRRKARLVAIGRSVAGSGFVVTTGGAATVQAPADFAEAVAEVDSRPVQPWSAAQEDLSHLNNEEFIDCLDTGYFDDWLDDFRRYSEVVPAEQRDGYIGD